MNVSVDALKQAFEGAKQDAGIADHHGGPWHGQPGQPGGGPGPAGATGGPGPGHDHGGGFAVVANLLNITPEQLFSELKGSTLADVATKHGKDPKDVASALVTDRQNRIKQLVTDGRITQTQADTMLAGLSDRVNSMLTHQMFAGGCGGPWGGHH